jgi:hypothetical protein
MLKIGKLYSCSEYNLLLYPDKATASKARLLTFSCSSAVARTTGSITAAVDAGYWSTKLNKSVSYCNPLTPLLIVNADNHYAEVLVGDKVVWIVNEDWLELKEIVDEAPELNIEMTARKRIGKRKAA